MKLVAKVRETIQKYSMLSRGDSVLVAVSGGPDSVALLHLLCGMGEEFGLRLEVAHLQHGIRGEEARRDARFVAEWAQALGVAVHVKEVDLPRMRAERGKGNLEAMGREERYRFLVTTAEERGIARVATAHTRDDQVETVLMWLLRGSGRRGLGGMAPIQQLISAKGQAHEGPLLIRPLIETSREEIIDYLASQNVKYQVDRTNQDTALQRNWIRLDLLPQLRERMDAHLDERLARLADLLRAEEELLEETAAERLERVVRGKDLLCEPLLKENRAMQRRLVRLWLEAVWGDLRGVGFGHVEDALEFIALGPPQAHLSISKGWTLIKEYKTLRLEKRSRRRKPVCFSYTLPRDGELVIPEASMKMQSSRGFNSSDARPRDDREALFDLASLPEELTVRNFRNGDRFQPLGMQGHKKVKDLFIEKKVPLATRVSLPLLLAGDEILWIPKYGRSEVAKISSKTKEVLRVRLVDFTG